MDYTIIFETERLLHRRPTLEDVDAVFEIMGNADVMKSVGDGTPMRYEKVKGRIDFDRKHPEKHGSAHGIIIFKANNEIIGYGGVGLYHPDKFPDLEMGYQYKKTYWGQGLATEFSVAAIDYTFNVLKGPQVYATTMPENIASNRVLEKSGMRFKKYVPDANRNVYEVEPDYWPPEIAATSTLKRSC